MFVAAPVGMERRLSAPARIGPNAVLQTSAALQDFFGQAFQEDMLGRAGLDCYIADPPQHMIPQDEAIRLFRVIHQTLDAEDAAQLAREAGFRTGDYILAHRIPKPAQRLLKMLPPELAARALLAAIGKHAWTFAGSGRVSWAYGSPSVLEIEDNPMAFPRCHWHRAVFARLFGRLVSPGVRITHTHCCAEGAASCRFEIAL